VIEIAEPAADPDIAIDPETGGNYIDIAGRPAHRSSPLACFYSAALA
jgi:hypothetical protein